MGRAERVSLLVGEPPPLLRTLRPEIPRALEEAVLASLDKDQESRPGARKLARLLAQAMDVPVPEFAREQEVTLREAG